MFKPTSMRKVNIFVSEDHVVPVTIALARLRILHLDEGEISEEWETSAGAYWSRRADEYTSLDRRLEDLLSTLGAARKEHGQPEDMAPREDARNIEDQVSEVEKMVRDWQDRKREAEATEQRLELAVEGTRLLRPLDVSIDALRELQYLHLAIGTIPWDGLASLEKAIFRIPFAVIPTVEQKDRVLIFAASTQDNAPILDLALKSAFFEPLRLPQGVGGSPDEELEGLEQRLEEARERVEALEDERRQMLEEQGGRLSELWRLARADATVTDMVSRFGRHGETRLIVGWVPEHNVDELVHAVREATDDEADVEILEPRKGGSGLSVPTLLENPKFLKPFEKLVSTFGFPKYNEIDPTPLVALTFVLMYGMMFGDVGHGLLLALGGLWLARRHGGPTWLGPVIAAAGLSGAAFGVLYGSLFGREDILPQLWLNPFSDIMSILIASIVAGVVLLCVGFVLSLASAWRARDWGDLLFSDSGVAGFALYLTLAGGGAALLQGVAVPTLPLAGLIVGTGAVILFRAPLNRLTAGQRPILEKGWGEDLVQSAFELFETFISYFTNSLSFVRLGAFAIAHVGLSRVVLILSEGSSGWLQWVIILIGALVIVGFEGLIVGIQTLRLEYYEFFGKFFQGGGHAFQPFGLPGGEET